MKKITVGDKEYFLDDEVVTLGVMQELERLRTEGLPAHSLVTQKISEAMGKDVFDAIPYSDAGEVIGKAFAELFLPNVDSTAKENAIKIIMQAFNGNN
jgi:hypothetical protein